MNAARPVLLLVLALLATTLLACSGDGAMVEDAPDAAAEAEVASGQEPAAAVEAEAPPAQEEPEAGGMLERVRGRGTLICGVQDKLPGFGFINQEGEYEGFDVDFCHAIAAAALGDPDAVTFRPVSAAERFTALQTGEVDVLIRNTTWNLTRDTQNGLDFAPTTFYDGQGMMVRIADAYESLEDLDGATICVGSGTTTEKNLADAMRKAGSEFSAVVLADADQVFGAYDEGRCDGVTSDKSQIVSRQTTLADPAAHKILDVTMSKEPLGPAVLQGDPQWADLVNWVVLGIVTAEELGVTSGNIDDFADSDDPVVRRFLALEETGLGQALGLSDDFMVDVVRAVGNYSEIYDRNLGPDTPFNLPRGLNRLWTDSGLLYAPPFK